MSIYTVGNCRGGGVNWSCLSCWMAVNWGSLLLLSPGKTCQCADLAGGSAVSSSTSSSSCCSSSSPLPPSSSTQWTSLMSQDLWRVCGSEFSRAALTLSFIPRWCHQLILFPVPSRAQSLPSSSQPFCCGRCQCSCPSSSTTLPSLSPTGPGTHWPSVTT